MTHVGKEVLCVPGMTHVKEVCATLNQAHKLQIGTQLLEADDGYCYIYPTAPKSVQTEYLAQLLSLRDADHGNLKATVLDLTMLQSKTSAAQAEAFKESLREEGRASARRWHHQNHGAAHS
eukprot:4680993-Pleurochrysis_carterae.AAC.1